jgi:hypothetical protein
MRAIHNARSFLRGLRTNIPGEIRVNEKIIVIESDDWGSIRTPSKSVLDAFRKNAFELDKSIYKVDALESSSDIVNLFDLLGSFRNDFGETPIFTTNTIVANPDFEKIRESDFKTYHYEKFTETYKKYPEHSTNLSLLKQGIQQKLIFPQFHGREHLDIPRWMEALRSGNEKVLYSFSLGSTYSGKGDYSFMGAFDWSEKGEIEQHKAIIADGLNIFRDTFGFESKSFIAPCYSWDSDLEYALEENGVSIIQGQRMQLAPSGILKKYKLIPHYFGQRNSKALSFNVRNVFFEPVNNPNFDWTDEAMAGIQAAFLMKRPAVISTHRLNYIGFIDERNASNGLKQLKNLLKKILEKWPDVKFVSTNQLEKYFNNERG